jgi:hypothetical protein
MANSIAFSLPIIEVGVEVGEEVQAEIELKMSATTATRRKGGVVLIWCFITYLPLLICSSNRRDPSLKNRRNKRLTRYRQNENIQNALTILTSGGNVRPDFTKSSGAIFGTKTSRNLWFQFDHAEIPFRLIIGQYRQLHPIQPVKVKLFK